MRKGLGIYAALAVSGGLFAAAVDSVIVLAIVIGITVYLMSTDRRFNDE